ncbi:MAG: hypothetical protein SStaTSB_41020 [Shewanella algae]
MWEWIKTVYIDVVNSIYNLYYSIMQMLYDIPVWLFSEIMSLSRYAITQVLALFEPIDLGQYLTGIPPEVSWTLSMVGLPQCLGIITSAIVIRMILQLIPFTRLGS